MLIKVHVQTEARKESVEKISENTIEISVTEPAKDNRANSRVFELLKTLYPQKRIKLIAGHHHPHKVFEIFEVDN